MPSSRNPRKWDFREEIEYNSDESVAKHSRVLKRNGVTYSECTFVNNGGQEHKVYEYVSDKQFHGDKNHHKHWVNKIKKRYKLETVLTNLYEPARRYKPL